MLGWGLVACTFGLAMVTNFRGFAGNFARHAEASSAGLRKLPLWKWQQPQDRGAQATPIRLLTIPFAIVGLAMILTGIISISQGHITSRGLAALPVPLRYLFIAFAVAAVGRSWLSRRGLFRPAARRGGWRFALALLASLGALIFAVSTAMGQATIGFAAWVIGALPSLVLLTEDKPARPGPGNVHD